jgi:hypothetical protein
LWDRDEMRREGACEVGGKWDATFEASRQPFVPRAEGPWFVGAGRRLFVFRRNTIVWRGLFSVWTSPVTGEPFPRLSSFVIRTR